VKYIITESQHNKLFENKSTKVDVFQELVDRKLNYIRNHCDEMDSEEYGGDIGFESCDEVKSIEKIRVTDVEYITSKHHPYDKSTQKTLIILHLVIDYNSIKYQSYDNIIWDLKEILKSSTGLPIDIHFDANNLRKNFEW
jgi:hypothetical protein